MWSEIASISLGSIWWFIRWPVICALWITVGVLMAIDNGDDKEIIIAVFVATVITGLFANYGV